MVSNGGNLGKKVPPNRGSRVYMEAGWLFAASAVPALLKNVAGLLSFG